MNPWWLLLIVPVSVLAGMIGLVVLAWLTRGIFPTLFMPDAF